MERGKDGERMRESGECEYEGEGGEEVKGGETPAVCV